MYTVLKKFRDDCIEAYHITDVVDEGQDRKPVNQDHSSSGGRAKFFDGDADTEMATVGFEPSRRAKKNGVPKAMPKKMVKNKRRSGEWVTREVRGIPFLYTVTKRPQKLLLQLDTAVIPKLLTLLAEWVFDERAPPELDDVHMTIAALVCRRERAVIHWRKSRLPKLLGRWYIQYHDESGQPVGRTRGLEVRRHAPDGRTLNRTESVDSAEQALRAAKRKWNDLDQSSRSRLGL